MRTHFCFTLLFLHIAHDDNNVVCMFCYPIQIQYTKRVTVETDEHFDTRSIYIILRDVKKEGLDYDDRVLTEVRI